MRTNTFDPASGTVTVSAERARAIERVAGHYLRLFGADPSLADLRESYALHANAVPDARRREKLSAFFFWTSWAAYTRWPFSDLYSTQGDRVEVRDYERYNFVTPIMKPDNMTRSEVLHAVLRNYRRFYFLRTFFSYPWLCDRFMRKYLLGCVWAVSEGGVRAEVLRSRAHRVLRARGGGLQVRRAAGPHPRAAREDRGEEAPGREQLSEGDARPLEGGGVRGRPCHRRGGSTPRRAGRGARARARGRRRPLGDRDRLLAGRGGRRRIPRSSRLRPPAGAGEAPRRRDLGLDGSRLANARTSPR